MIQISTFNKTVVYKKILITPGFTRRFWLAYQSMDVHVIGFFIYRNQFGLVSVAQQLNDSLFMAAGF